MSVMTLHITLAACAVIWLLACMLLYRIAKHAAWLAGSTVASCLFFLGITVLASVLVPEALSLLPLWLGVLLLAVCHLHAARHEATWVGGMSGVFEHQRTADATPPAGENPGAYI